MEVHNTRADFCKKVASLFRSEQYLDWIISVPIYTHWSKMQMQENTISADTSSAIKSNGRPTVYVLSSLLITLQLICFHLYVQTDIEAIIFNNTS
jgi:hypothetical protein